MSTQDAYEAARDAAVGRMRAVKLSDGRHVSEPTLRRLLDALLAVPECPDCEAGMLVPDAENYPGDPCPSCGGSGQSRVRLAFIERVPYSIEGFRALAPTPEEG